MLKERKKARRGKYRKEYFLSVPTRNGFLYHDFYDLRSLCKLPECIMSEAGLNDRIKKLKSGMGQDTLWSCMTEAKMMPKRMRANSAKQEFIDLMQLWPVLKVMK